MNVVMIIPTGIGCPIGGHAGDATPAAKLLGACCDKLILHPNVVNASDINEMPPNALYVEGSQLDSFLAGDIKLREVTSNRILVVVNKPVANETINAVSAARATLGADIRVLELATPLTIKATKSKGAATGIVNGWEELVAQVQGQKESFDALCIVSEIRVGKKVALDYARDGGVNPWGGAEAKASRLIAQSVGKPVAHAPFGDALKDYNEIVLPEMAAEFVSTCYMHCALKGLHRSPRISDKGLSVDDVDCLVSPCNCWGPPHKECYERDEPIPIIMVGNNEPLCWTFDIPDDPQNVIIVENYLEAAGTLMAIQAGITTESLERPLTPTSVIRPEKVQ
jgi:hypothetical protein